MTLSDISLSQNNERLKIRKKISEAIPAPVSSLTQWIRAFVTLGENTFQNLKTLQPKNETISYMCSEY